MEEELLGAGVFAAYEAPEWGSAERGDLTAVGLAQSAAPHCRRPLHSESLRYFRSREI